LKIKGKPRPVVTLFVVLVIGLLIGVSIRSAGYFWVMLVPNLLLLFVTLTFFFAYLEADRTLKKHPDKFPDISVLIPCYNSKDTIFDTIAALKASDYPGKMEILVVDDGSTDGSRELLKSVHGIQLVLLEKNMGKAAALNTGIRMVRSPVIACVDSDTYPTRAALKHAVAKLLEDDEYGAVTCFIKVAHAKGALMRVQEIEYYTGFGFAAIATNFLDAIFVAPGPTTIFRRSVMLEIGGFDEENITEDLEIAWRLRRYGYRLGYAIDAVVKTDVPGTLNGLFKQRLRWYRGKLFNLMKYGDMIFNPKYGNFGMFVLPFSFSAELAAVTLSFSFLYIIANQLIWLFGYLSTMLALHSVTFDISGFGVVGMPAIAMGVILVMPWFIVVYISHLLAQHEWKLSDVPNAFLFLFFYGTVISVFYCISFIMEVNRSDYSWK